MDLPPDKLKIVTMLPDEKKIQFLNSLAAVSEKNPPEYYIRALSTYVEGISNQKSRKPRLTTSESSTQLIKNLEVSLRTNPISWVHKYLDAPLNGLDILITTICNNQIFALPGGIFNECEQLVWISFNNNEITALPKYLFNKCEQMQRIYFNNNQISEIPEGIFHKCTHLTTINFALNRIKEFHFNYFSSSTKVRSLNLEKNNIQAVSFNALEPFSKSTDINFTNNCLQNSKSIYSSLLQHKSYSLLEYSDLSKTYFYKKLDSSQYFIIRQYEEVLVEKYFLALYLSSSSKTYEYICSVKSNFDRYNSKEMADPFQTEFSLLDLFISYIQIDLA
jgi:Leucine-rich repeat (LRR) protein